MATASETNYRDFKVDGKSRVVSSMFSDNAVKSTRYT